MYYEQDYGSYLENEMQNNKLSGHLCQVHREKNEKNGFESVFHREITISEL